MKIILTILTSILFCLPILGQTKKYVEEIALYHLDSLTKVDPAFKNFHYFTNGYVEKQKTSTEDSTFIMKVKPDKFIETPFKNLTIVEDTTIKSFSVPKRLRKNKGSEVLNIYRFLKIGQEYFVFFKIELKDGGQTALIIIDLSGNLKRRGIGSYIY
jgi:hypothetical protein